MRCSKHPKHFDTPFDRFGWLAGLLAGGALLALGAGCGQFGTIWQKAVLICLECIGIG